MLNTRELFGNNIIQAGEHGTRSEVDLLYLCINDTQRSRASRGSPTADRPAVAHFRGSYHHYRARAWTQNLVDRPAKFQSDNLEPIPTERALFKSDLLSCTFCPSCLSIPYMALRLTWSIERLRAGSATRLARPTTLSLLLQTRTMASDVKSIFDPPAPGQKVAHDDKTYTTIQEGRAHILVPDKSNEGNDDKKKNAANADGAAQQVFYNPIQQFNRDLTVLAIKAYGEEVQEKKRKAAEQRSKKSKDRKERKEKKQAVQEAGQDVAITEATEHALAEDDVSKKRKRDEDVPKEDTNKVARPEDLTSPQSAKASTETAHSGDAMEIGDAPEPTVDASGNSSLAQQPQSEVQDDRVDETVEATNGEKREADRRPRFTILDALSASGLRALRYAHELPFVTKVTANDLDPAAVEAIVRNARHNSLEHAIEATQGDALGHMYSKIAAHLALTEKQRMRGKTEKYDVIDLDPYGTAAPFFDAAVQAVRDDGGLLCVTCTDAGLWASNSYPEKCFALYGGVPIKGLHGHEVGLRIILHGISTSAARYGLYIEPLLSLSIDFYSRIFVKIRRSPAAVKFVAGKTMLIYNCDAGCGAWSTQILLRNKSYPNKKASGSFYKHQFMQGPTADQYCEHCGSKTHIGGPMYAGRIQNPEFIKRVLDKLPEADKTVYGTTDRIRGMLTTALEEHLEEPQTSVEEKAKSAEDIYSEIEPYPFYFMPTGLARILHCSTPGEDAVRGALRGLGYRVTRSHCKPGSIKTDAPWSVLWLVMREWIRQKAPIQEKNLKIGSPGYRILGLGAKTEKQSEGQDGGTQVAAEGEGSEKVKSVENDQKPEVVFDTKLGREQNKEKLVRYQVNPRENWGPLARAGR